MKVTIVVQRACVVAGCLLWMLLFLSPLSQALNPGQTLHRLGTYLSRDIIIAILILFGIVERMCAVGNNLVMERDWVPTIASQMSSPPLHQLNATMRRIDLVSKILAPVFVSTIAIKTSSIVLVTVTAGVNLATVGVELATARTAWNKCNALKLAREPKSAATTLRGVDGHAGSTIAIPDGTHQEKRGLALYFSNPVCLASLSAALQSFSVLCLSGPMTTYLLTRHYSLSLITAARTATSVLEIGSTILFPPLAALLARHPPPALPDAMSVLGLGGATLQLLLLIPCAAALAALPARTDPAGSSSSPVGLTVAVFGFLGLSRLGHWTHNMAVQQIAQTRVAPRHRAEFSGVDMTFVSGAEIGRWACAAVWSRPEQFRGVAFAGLGSVVVVWGLFAAWIVVERRRRRRVAVG